MILISNNESHFISREDDELSCHPEGTYMMKRKKERLEKPVEQQRNALGLLKMFGQAHPSKRLIALIILVVAASFAVRLYNLGGQSLECEELYTIPASTGHHYVFFTTPPEARPPHVPVTMREYKELLSPDSGNGLGEVTSVLSRNVHMPLYFYFMHYWTKLFGISERALRLPSVVFGTFAVLMIFLLGREIFNPFVGLLGALLMGTLPEQIYFSQEARMYSLLVLLVTASTYAIALARKQNASKWPYALYFITSVAGLYTHYIYVFCFGFQALFLWSNLRAQKEHRRAWLTTQGAVVAAFLPWLLVAFIQKQTSARVIAWAHGDPPSGSILMEIASRTTMLISVPDAPMGWLSVIVAFALVLLGCWSLRASGSALWLLGLWIITPVAGILLMDALLNTHAVSVGRYWMVITPALYLLMAVGIQKVSRPSYQLPLAATLSVLLCFAAAWTAGGRLRRKPDDHGRLGRFVDEQTRNGNRGFVLTEGSNAFPLALAYYGRGDMNILQLNWAVDKEKKDNYREVMQRSDDVLLISSGRNQAAKILERNKLKLASAPARFGHVFVARYVRQQGSGDLPQMQDP